MSYRKIHIKNNIYEYVVGKRGVKIRNPDGSVWWIEKYKVKGMSIKEFYKEMERIDPDGDGRFDIGITPQNLKDYILKMKLLK